MVITANQLGGTESYIIEIEGAKVAQLMDVFEGQFDGLIDHLKILNDRMVLVNPRFPRNLQPVQQEHDQDQQHDDE